MTKNSTQEKTVAVILAAGMGMRIDSLKPKCLTEIAAGRTILDQQIENLKQYLVIDHISAVVGYKKELVMEHCPQLSFVYNEAYAKTNTSKSLLRALRKFVGLGINVLWLNGDVVFDSKLLGRVLKTSQEEAANVILVDNKKCGDEEVKYTVDEKGFIKAISKTVAAAKGEALGINLILAKDLPILVEHLESVENSDYFEKAVENMIQKDPVNFLPVDVGGLFCQEVDFPQDLESVRNYLNSF